MVQIVGTLVAFAFYLAGEHGRDMPMGQAATTVSALLDGLAAALEEAFALGGHAGALAGPLRGLGTALSTPAAWATTAASSRRSRPRCVPNDLPTFSHPIVLFPAAVLVLLTLAFGLWAQARPGQGVLVVGQRPVVQGLGMALVLAGLGIGLAEPRWGLPGGAPA